MGPRRLPPIPPNHPAARFIEYNSVLWPKRLTHCHTHCFADPRARSAQCPRQFAGILHATPSLRRLRSQAGSLPTHPNARPPPSQGAALLGWPSRALTPCRLRGHAHCLSIDRQISGRFKAFPHKTPGEYELSLAQVEGIHFTEVPFYTDVHITGLPGSEATYTLDPKATHAGGQANEEFGLRFHIGFSQPGTADNPSAVKACMRKRRHVARFFSETSKALGLQPGPEWSPFFASGSQLVAIVDYYRDFTRQENPLLTSFIKPFVDRFVQLLSSKDILLFLCHASEDKPFVDRLSSFLSQQAVPVWYDRYEIQVGESIVQRVGEGLSAASHVVVILSQASVQKPWVLKELSSSLMRQLRDASVTLMPVIAEDCVIPPLLSDIKYADCRRDSDKGFADLLEAIL